MHLAYFNLVQLFLNIFSKSSVHIPLVLVVLAREAAVVRVVVVIVVEAVVVVAVPFPTQGNLETAIFFKIVKGHITISWGRRGPVVRGARVLKRGDCVILGVFKKSEAF